MKNPCFNEETRTDCPKRCAGCAVNCPEWAKYVEERNEEYRRRKIQTDADCVIWDGRSKMYKRLAMQKLQSGRSHRKSSVD